MLGLLLFNLQTISISRMLPSSRVLSVELFTDAAVHALSRNICYVLKRLQMLCQTKFVTIVQTLICHCRTDLVAKHSRAILKLVPVDSFADTRKGPATAAHGQGDAQADLAAEPTASLQMQVRMSIMLWISRA